jgi:mevalonate kinase
MITASAPGKVILFGEHAVVYGEPALAGAIDRRVYITAREYNKGIKITSSGKTISYVDSYKGSEFPYIRKAIELTFDYLHERKNLEIKINSNIPPAAGLGSSASVSVATILAVSKLVGANLSKDEIAKIGHNVELEVQGAASPTDTATTTFGGILYIQPTERNFERLEIPLPLVVGYTGIRRSTRYLVEKVRMLKEMYPDIITSIIRGIGEIVKCAKHKIERGEDIGGLMDINHGMLEALGVGHQKLSELVYISRLSGAKGAKLTGAGGGGCMIAYTPEKSEEVIASITSKGYQAFNAPITLDGVRLE